MRTKERSNCEVWCERLRLVRSVRRERGSKAKEDYWVDRVEDADKDVWPSEPWYPEVVVYASS